MLFGKTFELTGLNQMTATAQKQPGITANSAILTVADLQSERFSTQWRSYQQCFVEQCRQDLRAIGRIAEQNPNFAVRWTGAGFLRQIKAADWRGIDEKMYDLSIQAAPSSKGTAADRIQRAVNMFQAGALSQEALAQVQLFFDANHEIQNLSKQRAYIDRMVERWLDATPEQVAENVWRNGVRLIQADAVKFLRLEDGLVQVYDAYLDALLAEAPEEVMTLFTDWISMAKQELDSQRSAAAALQATVIRHQGGAQEQAQPPPQETV